MERTEIEKIIKEIVTGVISCDVTYFDPTKSLLKFDLCISIEEMADIVHEIELEFKIIINEKEKEKWNTVSNIIDTVETMLNS